MTVFDESHGTYLFLSNFESTSYFDLLGSGLTVSRLSYDSYISNEISDGYADLINTVFFDTLGHPVALGDFILLQ